MKFLKNIFRKSSKAVTTQKREISFLDKIPEPTRSLIFASTEDPSKAHSALSISFIISFTENGFETREEKRNSLHAEPSLIWLKLPIRENNHLESNPMYFPTYLGLSPEQRFQYLNWLQDVTQPTNLSYVFLYFYGLERHLMLGNFEKASEEVFRLLKFHDKGSFRVYAQASLVISILHHKRFDLFEKYSFLYEGVSNEVLLARKRLGKILFPEDIIQLASKVGFKNKRYINKFPKEFLTTLGKLVNEYEEMNGPILDCIPFEELKSKKKSFFANTSFPENVRFIETPQLLPNPKFQKVLFNLLQKTHDLVKKEYGGRKS